MGEVGIWDQNSESSSRMVRILEVNLHVLYGSRWWLGFGKTQRGRRAKSTNAKRHCRLWATGGGGTPLAVSAGSHARPFPEPVSRSFIFSAGRRCRRRRSFVWLAFYHRPSAVAPHLNTNPSVCLSVCLSLVPSSLRAKRTRRALHSPSRPKVNRLVRLVGASGRGFFFNGTAFETPAHV